jgi:ribosome-binding protein aMBF1 (putative translation factor)
MADFEFINWKPHIERHVADNGLSTEEGEDVPLKGMLPMPRSRPGRLEEADLPADVRARLAARRAESETPEYQARRAEEVARLQEEFPPLQPDEALWELLAALRLERERQGLTLADVAARTQIDSTTISKLENGRLPNPTYSTLRALARALGLRLGWTVEKISVDVEA